MRGSATTWGPQRREEEVSRRRGAEGSLKERTGVDQAPEQGQASRGGEDSVSSGTANGCTRRNGRVRT